MGFGWAPTLDEVGALVPYRTRSTDPDDLATGTFDADTTPTGDQAQMFVDNAVTAVVATAGEPAALPNVPVSVAQLLASSAKVAAAWRAAADIELAYPTRPGDVQIFTQLDQRAFEALTAYETALAQTGSGTIEAFPVSSFPAPDDLLNSVVETNPYLIITD